ncbi:MerR HTH family regulatory protein [Chitinophaga eiseniae]|uniref:MerR HTH family regulatory protein n=1 Tax=Chitinophaga eiseniae TaxID=634771 RepID=A0A1T4SPN9_9BACT|nr:chaperone modulator CbpM [Chitinophaga eiseniae]SKA30254.1 MerR HTH family regulatory protein [Chitinophaga eiseniae]
MENTDKLTVEQCSQHYNIATSFLFDLDDHGLIVLMREEQSTYLHYDQLPLLEKYMRLHFDLLINMEGLEAVSHLLERVQLLQTTIRRLGGEVPCY